MKLLIVTSVDPWTRSVSSVEKFIRAGEALGHEISIYGEAHEELPSLPFSSEFSDVDLAFFIIQVPTDIPDMPGLAKLLDGVPPEKRMVIDLWGKYNDTILIEHDFNHLEKFDGHLGWEWEEAIKAISPQILQPGLNPLREDVHSFLFHGFNETAIVKNYETAEEAAASWREVDGDNGLEAKPYGVMYVGSNWQRWHQVRQLLEVYSPLKEKIGPPALFGWDWGWRPDWAVEKGIMGVDTDLEFLEAEGVGYYDGVRYDEVAALQGYSLFAPVLHRPLFEKLGFVTGRSFETFYADTLPVLMLEEDFVKKIYGSDALPLVTTYDKLADHLADAFENPVKYWDAVLKTRKHLAQTHSYTQRFKELEALYNGMKISGVN